MASNSVFKQALLDILTALGLGFGAGSAAAAGELRRLQSLGFQGNQSTPLSAELAATAVVKNETGGLDMVQEAAYNGVSGSRFQVMIDATGNPPGPETLAEMLNRGAIDDATWAKGLRQGYLKDEWIDAQRAVRTNLIPAAEIVQAVVQDQLSMETGRALWAQVGMFPDHFDIAVATAGNPPGPTETLTMLNRGIFTADDAAQALRESRLKDKYIPQFLQLARRRIPFRTLNTLVKNKAISVEYALQQLEELGYSEADAQALIKSALTATTTAHHALTEAQIVALYEAHKSTQAEAVAQLVTLGYDAQDAAEVLALGDTRALLKLRDQVVTALRGRFIAHRIDEATTRADLAAAGVEADQQDQLLTLWKIEQTANPRELTEAQLRAAVNANVIPVTEYTSRLVGMGYTAGDADILTQTHFPPTTAAAAPPTG